MPDQKTYKTGGLIGTLLICVACFSQAPSLSFQTLTHENGLPSDIITCLAQDSTGFFLIGSHNGLFRFDGKQYKSYHVNRSEPGGLHTNYIHCLYVDSKGVLWIANYNKGLCKVEKGNTTISPVEFNGISNSLSWPPLVYDIKEDKQGNLWFACFQGLLRLTPQQRWIFYPTGPGLHAHSRRDSEIYQLSFDPSGNLLIAGFAGLLIFDPHSEKFIFPEGKLRENFEERWCFKSACYLNHKLWFSTWTPDLGVYNTESQNTSMLFRGQSLAKPEFSKMALSFYPDSKGAIWIASENGLHYVAPGAESISQSYYHESDNPASLPDSRVNAIMEDREGNIWIATDNGIGICVGYKYNVFNFSTNVEKDYAFANKQVSDIVELPDHSFLIGTHMADGIYLADSNFLVKKRFSFHDARYDWGTRHYQDHHQLYFITHEGLLEYDANRQLMRKSTDPILATRLPIATILRLSDDETWICRDQEIARYNSRTKLLAEYSLQNLGEPSQNILLAADRDKNLWIVGHETGLMRFDPLKEKIVEKMVPDSTTNSIRQAGIWVFLDLGESYLLGYDRQGISLYHKQTKKFEHFTRNDGLVSDAVRAAFIADDHTVWIATTSGISQFDPATKTFYNYDHAQGLLHTGFTCISSISGGRIAAGSKQGLVVFHPAKEVLPSPPVLIEFKVLENDVAQNSRKDGFYTFSPKENYFSFDFISPQVPGENELEYAYRLEGLDNDWVFAGTRHFVSYATVPAGHYAFKIKCRQPGGAWVENTNAISIIVKAPFYSHWWFYLFIGLIIAGVAYAAFRYRLQQLLRVERLRHTISSDLHDEVGASLTSISIFSEMARNSSPSPKEQEYLLRIGERSRDSIEKLSDIIWSINPESDTLQQMLERMKNYANEIAEVLDIVVHWEEKGDLLHAKLSMEFRKNIYLIYKEAINNAVKYSEAQNIYVHLESTRQGMALSIRDDGKGFDTAKVSKGNGLKNMNRRAAVLKGSIEIRSAATSGTTIKLFIPY